MTAMHQIEDFRDSSALLADPPALRLRACRDGYIFLRGVLPAEALLALRTEIAGLLCELGWIDTSEPLSLRQHPQQDAVFECSSDAYRQFYERLQCLRSFHALAHHPQCRRFADAICGGPGFFHPRHICRLMFPGAARFTTPPHQDYFYIGGTEETWTAWIPVGHCPRALGSLAVLPGSHRHGLLPVEQADGAGGHACSAESDSNWHAADFQCGDVLCLHSLCVHQGQDNQTVDRLRLSLDLRFQAISEPVHRSSLEPHLQFLSWEQVYRDWPAHDGLKYYWRQLPLQVCD